MINRMKSIFLTGISFIMIVSDPLFAATQSVTIKTIATPYSNTGGGSSGGNTLYYELYSPGIAISSVSLMAGPANFPTDLDSSLKVTFINFGVNVPNLKAGDYVDVTITCQVDSCFYGGIGCASGSAAHTYIAVSGSTGGHGGNGYNPQGQPREFIARALVRAEADGNLYFRPVFWRGDIDPAISYTMTVSNLTASAEIVNAPIQAAPGPL